VGRTLVLGGGFGGISVASSLRQSVTEDHEIVLVDGRESFAMGLRKLWEIAGIGTIAEGSRVRLVSVGTA
jgi:NADH dehydrogenase FAD-containing subunit